MFGAGAGWLSMRDSDSCVGNSTIGRDNRAPVPPPAPAHPATPAPTAIATHLQPETRTFVMPRTIRCAMRVERRLVIAAAPPGSPPTAPAVPSVQQQPQPPQPAPGTPAATAPGAPPAPTAAAAPAG